MRKIKAWMESNFLPNWLYYSILGTAMIFLRCFLYDCVTVGLGFSLVAGICIYVRVRRWCSCMYCPIEKHKLSPRDIFQLCPDCDHRQCQSSNDLYSL